MSEVNALLQENDRERVAIQSQIADLNAQLVKLNRENEELTRRRDRENASTNAG